MMSAITLEPPTITTGGSPMLRYPAIIAVRAKAAAANTLRIRVCLGVSMLSASVLQVRKDPGESRSRLQSGSRNGVQGFRLADFWS
jgi:hypothetical protein